MAETTAHVADAPTAAKTARRPLKAFVMDLCCFIPFYTSQLCRALQDEQVEATLGSIRYYLQPDYFQRLGLRNYPGLLDVVSRMKLRSRILRRGLKLAEASLNLVALAVRFVFARPDLVHVQYLAMMEQGVSVEYWFLRFCRLLGIKIVYTVHNVLPQDNGVRRKKAFARIYRLPDLFICHGAAAKKQLIREFGVDAGKIRTIPHGPLFAEGREISRAEARATLGFEQDGVILLSLGVISPYKGTDWLLDAWHRVGRKHQARLVIAGTGDPRLLAEIEQKVQRLGMGKSVHLHLSFIPVELLANFYQAADVLVYPYREVTTSGALTTGIGYGKAIVATRLPAFEELLRQGESALMVDYGDVDGLAVALEEVISDGTLRSRLAEGAVAVGREWSSWAAIAEQTRACYDAVAVD